MSHERNRGAALDRLEKELGHAFRDRALLETALRHSSCANELSLAASSREGASQSTFESNERLEFLGDAVLAAVVAEALYRARPDWREGDLTRALHSIVEGRSLASLAASLGVGEVLALGRTEESSGGREKPSILENAMEALIGAMYLDAGLPSVERLVAQHFEAALASDAVRVERDPKTELQEALMAEEGEFPSYQVVVDTGIEGDDGRFTVEVTLKGRALGRGIGRTKRAAEKSAAGSALEGRRDTTTEEE